MLKSCIECGRQVSDTADNCPYCGYKYNSDYGDTGVSSDDSPRSWILPIILSVPFIVIALVIGIYILVNIIPFIFGIVKWLLS
jgi:hypothetical protein